jgi:hypothetical protein
MKRIPPSTILLSIALAAVLFAFLVERHRHAARVAALEQRLYQFTYPMSRGVMYSESTKVELGLKEVHRLQRELDDLRRTMSEKGTGAPTAAAR